MLAHKAEDEGIAVAENIAGLTGIVNHDVIPSVVYTNPEIAGVGLTEEAAKERGEVKVGKFPMLANSRAKTNHEPDGFVKVIADAKTDRVLGVWVIASVGGTMIAQAAQAMEFGATSEDIAYTCHAHPDPFGSDQGSSDGGARQADPHLSFYTPLLPGEGRGPVGGRSQPGVARYHKAFPAGPRPSPESGRFRRPARPRARPAPCHAPSPRPLLSAPPPPPSPAIAPRYRTRRSSARPSPRR